MPCTINNNTSNDLSQLEDLTQKLVPFAQKQIGFNRPPTINFDDDEKNAADPFGKTAQYDPSNMEIVVFVTGRHIKDVLRSIAHELVHHGQNLRGDLNNMPQTELGYAQNNDHMREMEREAYEVGNLCFRDWEDGIKQQLPLYETIYRETLVGGENMSTKDWKDQELNNLLMKKWGYGENLNEELDAFIDSSKGGDYQTGQKVLDKDAETLDEDEESSDELHQVAQSVEFREREPKYTEELEETKKKNNKLSLKEFARNLIEDPAVWEENLPLLESYIKKSVGKKAFDENYDFFINEFKTEAIAVANSEHKYILNEGKGKDPCKWLKGPFKWLCQLIQGTPKKKPKGKAHGGGKKKPRSKRPDTDDYTDPAFPGQSKTMGRHAMAKAAKSKAAKAALARRLAVEAKKQAKKNRFYKVFFRKEWAKCKANPGKCSAKVLAFFGVGAAVLAHEMGWRAVDDPDYKPTEEKAEAEEIEIIDIDEPAGGLDIEDDEPPEVKLR